MDDRALKDFTIAIDLAPRSWGDYMYRGELYKKLGQKQKADADQKRSDILFNPTNKPEFFSAAIAEDPAFVGAYYMLTDRLMKAGQYREALDVLTQLIRLKPSVAEEFYLRGQCWEKLKNFQNSVKDYTAAIELDPSGSQAMRWTSVGFSSRGLVYKARGDIYANQGEKQKAINDFSSVISIDPKNHGAYVSRAFAYDDLENDYAALRDKSEAIKLTPENPLLYQIRARTYQKLHQYEKGVEDCSTAIGIMSKEDFQAARVFGDPRSSLADAYYERGQLFFMMNIRSVGEADFQQAISLWPNIAERIDLLKKVIRNKEESR